MRPKEFLNADEALIITIIFCDVQPELSELGSVRSRGMYAEV